MFPSHDRYVRTGSIELSGPQHSLNGTNGVGAAKLIASVGDGQYKALVKDASGATTETITFSFDDTSDYYIRNVFNTDAYKSNAAITPTDDLETYWLGETFEEMVNREIVTGSGKQLAIILGLGQTGASTGKFQDHREPSKPAKTGFFINRDPNANTGTYEPANMEKLFRLASLHDGAEFQKEYYVSIEDLALGTSTNPDSSFTVNVRRWDNNAVVESYSNLNLNPASQNHIVKRIGDMNMVWSTTDKKFNIEGEYPNQSDYIRVEMADALKNGQVPSRS